MSALLVNVHTIENVNAGGYVVKKKPKSGQRSFWTTPNRNSSPQDLNKMSIMTISFLSVSKSHYFYWELSLTSACVSASFYSTEAFVVIAHFFPETAFSSSAIENCVKNALFINHK